MIAPMKKKFTEPEIVSILKEEEAGKPLKEICRAHGISETTFKNWKTLYGRMQIDDVLRMNNLAEENSRLKRIISKVSGPKRQ